MATARPSLADLRRMRRDLQAEIEDLEADLAWVQAEIGALELERRYGRQSGDETGTKRGQSGDETGTKRGHLAEEELEPQPTKQREPTAVREAQLRDWARERGSWFRATEAAEALGLSHARIIALLAGLRERGTMQTNGRPPKSSSYAWRFSGRPESEGGSEHRGNGKGHEVYTVRRIAVAGTGRPRGAGSKEVATLIARARARGWTLDIRSGAHDRLIFPANGQAVSLPNTPGDHRSLRNVEAEIKRKERMAPDG